MKHSTVSTFILCLLVMAIPAISLAGASEQDGDAQMRKKLKTIIIPKIQFTDTSVRTVFEYLKKRSRDLDPAGEGVNFLLILKPKPKTLSLEDKDAALTKTSTEPTVTLDMDNLPLSDAIRFICTQAGLNYVAEEHAVVVMDKAVTRKKLELRIFTIDPRVLKDVKDVKKFFENKGVTFPVSNQ